MFARNNGTTLVNYITNSKMLLRLLRRAKCISQKHKIIHVCMYTHI